MSKKPATKEKQAFSISGWILILLMIICFCYLLYVGLSHINAELPPETILLILCSVIISALLLKGFYSNQPNQATILMLFGAYTGTDKQTGIRWTIPFYTSVKISQRIEEYESDIIKVNDLNGNPIEVSSIVIWKVKDTYNAYFEVTNYSAFLKKQLEAALRELAMNYAYDSEDTSLITLTGNLNDISQELTINLQKKVVAAGIEILESTINHLSYAKEIAQAMLQKQQAGAIISARKLIVQGAVSMVETAIHELEQREIVSFDLDARRRLVSNLLVVLCSEQGTQPILNTDA